MPPIPFLQDSTATCVRLPRAQLLQVDELLVALRPTRGARYSRSDLIRDLLSEALEARKNEPAASSPRAPRP